MKSKALAIAMCALMVTGTTVGTALVQTVPAFAATENATENRAPVITVGASSFLVEKGSSFDLKAKLGLSVIDDKDGNITNTVTISTVDTSTIGCKTISIPAKDSGGLTSAQTVKVNIIEVEQTAKFDRFSAVANCNPSAYVQGDKTGLTIQLGEKSEDKSIFQVIISDGSNTLTKWITATDYQGVPFANNEGKVWYQGQWIPGDQWANREAYVKAHPADNSQVSTGNGTAPGDADSYVTGNGAGPGGATGPGGASATADATPGSPEAVSSDAAPATETASALPKTGDIVMASAGIAAIVAIGGVMYFGVRKRKLAKAGNSNRDNEE